MTKEARMPKREVTPDLADYFDIRASSFLRHLSFVLRHFTVLTHHFSPVTFFFLFAPCLTKAYLLITLLPFL